jgi:hypothetical protein
MATASSTDHIRILGWLYIALGALGVFGGLVMFGVLVVAGVLSNDATALSTLAILGLIFGGFIFVLSLPGIIGGLGLLRRYNWARLLVVVLGILQLGNVPFGTVLGVYTIWVLLINEPTANAFK